jgi:hypothetical protein
MKTLTKDNLSIYIFSNDTKLEITHDHIVVGDPIQFIIADCNSQNTVLHENITPPEDWSGHKYFFDGIDWSTNSNWVDHTLEEQTA